MNKSKPPIGWRMLKWLITLLTILYAAQVFILPRLQPGVEYADQIHPFYLLSSLLRFGDSFTLLLDIVIAIAICVGLLILIDKHCDNVANREKNAARQREEAARFSMTSMRMAGTKVAQQTEPTLTPIMEWCVAATKQVPKARHSEVFAELMSHLLDHRDDMVAKGYSVDAAERAAVEAMGDPATAAARFPILRRSMAERFRRAFRERGWEVVLRTEDEHRVYDLTHLLFVAGIPFRTAQRSNRSYEANVNLPRDGKAPRIQNMSVLPSRTAVALDLAGGMPAVPVVVYMVSIHKRDLHTAKRLVR